MNWRIIFLCTVLLLGFDTKLGFAQDTELVKTVSLRVRMVKALGGQTNNLKVSSELFDIKEKLSKLHYDNFQLLRTTTHQIVPERKEKIDIGDGHTLDLKLISKTKDRACVWLEWTDASGMQVINTRFHLNSSESMLTGTDADNESGMLLVIDLH